MNAEDLLLTTLSLMTLQEQQCQMAGRDFTPEDAMKAARPALESVLAELLDLQRAPAKCPHCSNSLTLVEEDLPIEDYDSLNTQEILDEINSPGANWVEADLEILHKYERKHQARGSVLSALTQIHGGTIDKDEDGNPVDQSAKLDKMFADLFKN